MSGHTPGKWYWGGDTLRAKTADDDWHGKIVALDPAREVGMANRALIANAPALLAALEFPRNTRIVDAAGLSGEWVAVPAEDFAKARSALKAAGGGA